MRAHKFPMNLRRPFISACKGAAGVYAWLRSDHLIGLSVFRNPPRVASGITRQNYVVAWRCASVTVFSCDLRRSPVR